MPSVRKLPAVIRGMNASDLQEIADEHGGLAEPIMSDEAYFAGFGLRCRAEPEVKVEQGPVPASPIPDEIVNSTLVTLLNRPNTLYPLYGDDPPVDDLDMLGQEEPVERLAEIATD